MALFKKKQEQAQAQPEQYGTPVVRPQPRGDYSKGHPGLPPRDYKAPKEKR